MKRRSLGILLFAALLSYGCMLNPTVFGNHGARALADNHFYVVIEPNRLKELGGASSPALREHVDQELAKKDLCKNGNKVLSEGWGSGYYYVRGRCH